MSSDSMRTLSPQEQKFVENAPPFDPERLHTEVHSHKFIKFKQDRIYYDAYGNAVSVDPPKVKVTRGVAMLRHGQNANKKFGVKTNRRVVGNQRLPADVVKARRENAAALAAETLLG